MKTRIRRGKEVEIPAEWVGVITTEKTKRARRVAAAMKVEGRRKEIRREIRREEILGE